MSTRIRYRKTSEENVVESVQRFVPTTNDGNRYYIRLNLVLLEYWVIGDRADTIKASGRANDTHRLKISAKKALEALGVLFDEKESRSIKSKRLNKTPSRTVVL